MKGCFSFLQGQTRKSKQRKKKKKKKKRVTLAKQHPFGTSAVLGWKESQEKSNVDLEANAWPLQVCLAVVVITFQITFRAEIHANGFFYFLKIIFDISTSKRSKTYKPY